MRGAGRDGLARAHCRARAAAAVEGRHIDVDAVTWIAIAGLREI
jgi:hypothetical protein